MVVVPVEVILVGVVTFIFSFHHEEILDEVDADDVFAIAVADHEARLASGNETAGGQFGKNTVSFGLYAGRGRGGVCFGVVLVESGRCEVKRPGTVAERNS